MKDAVFIFKDSYSCLQENGVKRLIRPAHEPYIGSVRDKDSSIHSSPGCNSEVHQKFDIRNEIGTRDPDSFLGAEYLFTKVFLEMSTKLMGEIQANERMRA